METPPPEPPNVFDLGPPRRTEATEAAWAALPEAELDVRRLRRQRVVTLEKRDPSHMAYDMLRTRILQRFRAESWRRLALTSPAPGCGKTLTSLNLAFSFARQPRLRTLILDFDLRRPRLATLLGIKPKVCISRYLSGEAPLEQSFTRLAPNLAAGLAAGPLKHSTELLQDDASLEALAWMEHGLAPDLIIYDLPPLLASDDAAAFLERVDGSLLVAAAGESALDEIDMCARQMGALTTDLGVILNKSAFMPRRYYGYGYGNY
ncbi:MAG: CpsD/CapB family tyrosine-protein kinase [Pseudomonadota bacterium]